MTETSPKSTQPREGGYVSAPVARRLEDLPPAARRALREAEVRRAAMEAEEAAKPREIGGRGGKDPARYGDWEVKGVAVDF